MTFDHVKAVLAGVIAAGATALLVDLSFHWRLIRIDAPGVTVEKHVTGWHGAGVPLALFVIVIIAIEAARLWRIAHRDELRVPVAPFLFSLPLLGLTVAQFMHSTTMTIAGTTFADAGAREWPAWTGLELAGVIVVMTAAGVAFDLIERSKTRPRVHAVATTS